MKKKSIIILISSVIIIGVIVASILLIKPKAESMNTDTVVEENVSDEIVVDENVTEEDKEDIEEVVIKEDVNDPLSQDNIIQLDDGTYDFTDDFLGTVMSYDYFAGSTEQEVKDYLNEIIEFIKDRSPEEISESLGALGFSTGSTLKQDTTSSVGEDSSTESGSNESNPSQPSGGGLITDPNYRPNLDPSIWGNTTTGGFGGGEQDDVDLDLH